MLKSMTIGNFKNFAETETINLKKLSLFSGVNGAGKSSIAQVILLIKETLTAKETGDSPYLVLTGFGNAIELLNNKEKPLTIGFTFDDDLSINMEFLLGKKSKKNSELMKNREYLLLNKMDITNIKRPKNDFGAFSIKRNNNGTWSINASLCVDFSDKKFRAIFYDYVDTFDDDILNHTITFENVKAVDFLSLILREFTIDEKDLINCIYPDYRSTCQIEEFKSQIRKENLDLKEVKMFFIEQYRVAEYFREIILTNYIEAFRGPALRIYDDKYNKNPLIFTKKVPNDVVAYDYDFEKKEPKKDTYPNALKYWINKLQIADSLEVHEIVDDYISETILHKDNRNIAINNDGFGLSQVLPMIARCLMKKSTSLIIDEPECHLHPKLQSQIGSFFFIMSLLNKQIIIETHSEYIINKINYLQLAYPEYKSNIISYWIEKKDCYPKVLEIEYDDFGFTKNAPEDFYDESIRQIELINQLRESKLLGQDHV